MEPTLAPEPTTPSPHAKDAQVLAPQTPTAGPSALDAQPTTHGGPTPGPERARIARASAVAVAVVVTLLGGALLHRLAFQGWAHSFDTAIYVRSLWGVAHGEWMNPVRDLHAFTIHGNFVFFAMVPLVWLFGATWTLLAAQSVALGATIGVTARAWVRVARSSASDAVQAGALPWIAALVLLLGTPLLSNPFLFDLRPDALGVPLLTVGLLRAHRIGDVDRRALAWMLSALLVREEYFMTIVGALVLCPFDLSVLRRSWRLRLAGCVFAMAWWALYFFGLRALIDDGSLALAQQVGAEFVTAGGAATGELTRARITLAVALFGGAGGLAIVGWRWLGAAAPGLLFLAMVDRLPEVLPNVHYAYFVAPGFAVASVDGLRRWLSSRRDEERGVSAAALAAHVGLVALVFATASAFPGGGAFRHQNFLLLRSAELEAETRAIRDLHAAVRRVRPELSLAAPHEVLALGAERSIAVPVATYAQRFDAESPELLDVLVLPRRNWQSVGRPLVDVHGYRLVDVVPPHAAVLGREDCMGQQVDALLAASPRAPCTDVVARWPSVGLEVCASQRSADGRRYLPVRRYAAAPPELPGLLLLAGPSGLGPTHPALALDGLWSPRDIPERVSVGFALDASIPGDVALDVMLVVPNGGPVPAQAHEGAAPTPRVEVR